MYAKAGRCGSSSHKVTCPAACWVQLLRPATPLLLCCASFAADDEYSPLLLLLLLRPCCSDPTNRGERCPTVACELSHTGPATFVRATTMGESTGAEAINMPITSFAGSSGSCALNAPDSCCYATSSWGITTCARNCLGNFYSPIMSTRPLSELWKQRQVVLASTLG
jgi:hypothetical protein